MTLSRLPIQYMRLNSSALSWLRIICGRCTQNGFQAFLSPWHEWAERSILGHQRAEHMCTLHVQLALHGTIALLFAFLPYIVHVHVYTCTLVVFLGQRGLRRRGVAGSRRSAAAVTMPAVPAIAGLTVCQAVFGTAVDHHAGDLHVRRCGRCRNCTFAMLPFLPGCRGRRGDAVLPSRRT